MSLKMSEKNSQSPCIDFSKETYINKKQITKMLHEHRVEFTPTKNGKGEYTAQIKLKVSPTKINKLIAETLGDPDLLSKIDKLFNIDTSSIINPTPVAEFITFIPKKSNTAPSKKYKAKPSRSNENISPSPMKPIDFPNSLRPPTYPKKKPSRKEQSSFERKTNLSASPTPRKEKPIVPALKLPQPFKCTQENLTYESPKTSPKEVENSKSKKEEPRKIDKPKQQMAYKALNQSRHCASNINNSSTGFKKIMNDYLNKAIPNQARSKSTPHIESTIKDLEQETVKWNAMKKETKQVNERVNSLVKLLNQNKETIDQYRQQNLGILQRPTADLLKDIETIRVRLTEEGETLETQKDENIERKDTDPIEITVSSRRHLRSSSKRPTHENQIEFKKIDYDSNPTHYDLLYGSLKFKENVQETKIKENPSKEKINDANSTGKPQIPIENLFHKVNFLGGFKRK